MNLRATWPLLALAPLAGCQLFGTAPTPVTSASTAPKDPVTQVATSSTQAFTPYLYVFSATAKTIDEINLRTDTVSRSSLLTGAVPNQFVTRGAVTYLVNSQDANVFKLDLHAGLKLDTINLPVGSWPQFMAFTDDTHALVLHNDGISTASCYVGWLNLSSKLEEATRSIPQAAWVNPGGNGLVITGGKAYIPATVVPSWDKPANFSGLYVFDVTTREQLKIISLPDAAKPTSISLDPAGKIEVGVSTGIITVDPSTDAIVRSVDLGTAVDAIQYLSATKAYGRASDGLVSFNPATGAVLRDASHKIPAPMSWMGTFAILGTAAYVTNSASNSVQAFDLLTETASGSPWNVGASPQELTFISVANP